MNSVQLKLVAGAIALGLVGSAFAQAPQEVRVQATRVVSSKTVGHSPSGVPIVDLSLTYGVSLMGLDLSTNSGATEAAKRISDAADAACKELGDKYPDATPSQRECAKIASEKAMVTLHGLVAAAEQTRK